MKKLFYVLFLSSMSAALSAQPSKSFPYQNKNLPIQQRIADLLKRMTPEEKAGQLNQINGGVFTGPAAGDSGQQAKMEAVRRGLVGSMLNVTGVAETKAVQTIAAEQSRLGIPLLFALDVIHGYKTVFPIPLAEACSWDPAMAEKTAATAAKEATAEGLHWTFAPMVDISYDARWGRVMEGAGEDPFLGAAFAAARVRGFQGNFSETNLMACIKHYALYGAVQAGREYGHVDMSRVQAWNLYLPPYKAGVQAGAATVMNGFNVFEGVPVSGHNYLINDVLKKQWGFKGFLVSDWASFAEMKTHGYAADDKDVALKALLAGSMMDMESRAMVTQLPALLREGKVPVPLVDSAVARILYWKFKLGLFDDPYKYCKPERADADVFTAAHKQQSREAAANSIVLLKNDRNILPLATDKKIALIGHWAHSAKDVYDFWVIPAKGHHLPVTVHQGLGEVYKELTYAAGYDAYNRSGGTLIAEAVAAAQKADVVVVNVGLSGDLAGEDRSLADPVIPAGQIELLKALKQTGKPIVALVSSGRPLVLTQMEPLADAIVQIWILGTEHGRAVADVVSGAVNPSAKTVMSFPYAVGQIPVHYNAFNTSRPLPTDNAGNWYSRFRDVPNEPLYPFGFGLSYTTFSYSSLSLSRAAAAPGQAVQASITVRNTGRVAGYEIVQLYVHDPVASVVRPVKELRGFQKIFLQPGESKTVTFDIGSQQLGFYDAAGQWKAESGTFNIMVGPHAGHVQAQVFTLL